MRSDDFDLHSTLFILVQKQNPYQLELQADLHSTLFILVPGSVGVGSVGSTSTFHSVYISTVVMLEIFFLV